MSIPKIIHYCWFGKNPRPASMEACIASWKKYCPGYQIIEWNEDSFDLSENRYAREAYSQKKWAFVTDYARLKILYEHGGVYLDTDVELIRSLDRLMELDGFMGFQDHDSVATGLGFGAKKGHPVVKALLDDYRGIPFILADGSFDRTACPVRNTALLRSLGLKINNEKQCLMDMWFFPSDYFAPKNYYTGKLRLTKNTYSIHHYDSSWLTDEERKNIRLERLLGSRIYYRWHKIVQFFHKKQKLSNK